MMRITNFLERQYICHTVWRVGAYEICFEKIKVSCNAKYPSPNIFKDKTFGAENFSIKFQVQVFLPVDKGNITVVFNVDYNCKVFWKVAWKAGYISFRTILILQEFTNRQEFSEFTTNQYIDTRTMRHWVC